MTGVGAAPRWLESPVARASLVILGAWLLLFGPQLFAGRVYVAGDAAAFRAFSEFSRARWRESGERTFWNPYVFAGMPAAASLADSRPQYLPDAALGLWESVREWPVIPPLAAPLALHLASMLSIALLARSLWGAGFLPMAWAGLAWGLMPNLLVPFAFGHTAQFVSASLLPVIALATHHLFASASRPTSAASALALAVLFGIQGLFGHPQIVAYGGIFTLAFALERALRHGRLPRLAMLVLALALGAALSAAVWWPAFLYGATSIRSMAPDAWPGALADFSLAPRDLASLVWPFSVGFGGATYWGGQRATDYPQYLGATVILAALWAWPRRRDAERGAAWLLFGVAGCALFLSLGPHGGALYRLVHERVPFFSSFRVPVAILILAQLAVALLSARGIARLVSTTPAPIREARKAARERPPARKGPRIGWIIAGAATILIAAAIVLGPLREGFSSAIAAARPTMDATRVAAATSAAGFDLGFRALLALAVLTIAAAAGGAAWGAAVLALTLALDLGSVSAPLLWRSTGTVSQLAARAPIPLARVAAADAGSRVLSLDSDAFLSNDWVSWRVRSLSGNHAAMGRHWSELMSAGLLSRYPALCALAVRYLAGGRGVRVDTSLCEPVKAPGSDVTVLRLKAALPRAYAVSSVEAPGNDRAVIAAVLDPAFTPATVAYSADATAAGTFPGSAACVIRWIVDAPDLLELETRTPDRAFVVVADAHFPGWEARVDGAPVPLHRVDHLIRGVAVPAGTHRVRMVYSPPGYRTGTLVTRSAWLAVFAAALGFAFAALARRRTRDGKV